MTQYNRLTVKLSNSQLNKLNFARKTGTKVTLNLSSNLIKSSNDETNFLHKLLLTDTQVPKICKVSENGSSANIKYSKIKLSKIVQLGGFLFGSPIKEIRSSANSIKDLFGKELTNKDPKEIEVNFF